MSRVFKRFMKSPYPKAVSGEGPYIIADDGKRYIDAASGAGVSSMGYNDREITRAIADQVQSLAYVYNAYFTTEPA